MTELVVRLLDAGRTVTLLVGDRADLALADELERRVRAARPDTGGDLTTSRAQDLAGLMSEMAAAEVVVASRFHNVICALKARRPVVSLGYAGKNAHLLEQFGLGGHDQPIDGFDVDRVLADVDRLSADQDRVSRAIGPVLADLEHEVARHLTETFASVLAPESRPRSATSRLPA